MRINEHNIKTKPRLITHRRDIFIERIKPHVHAILMK